MFKTFSYISLLACSLLFSCNQQEEAPDPVQGDNNPYQWNQEIRPAKTITGEELTIGKRICNNFEKKRAYMARQTQGLVMDYRVSVLGCGQNQPQVDRSRGSLRISRGGSLSMVSLDRNTPVFDDVLSDQHSNLEAFCEPIMANRVVSDTVTKGSIRYQISFFRESGRDWLQLAEFQAPQGRFYPYIIERASVVTEADSPREEQRGFVSLRAINRPCTNGATQYTMQEWL